MKNTTKEPKTPADKKVAFSLKISRTLDGVEIYAKSAAMSDLVRRALSAGESENHEQYGGPTEEETERAGALVAGLSIDERTGALRLGR